MWRASFIVFGNRLKFIPVNRAHFFNDVDTNMVKSGFIYDGAVFTHNNYDKQNSAIKLNNATAEIIQKCYDNQS